MWLLAGFTTLALFLAAAFRLIHLSTVDLTVSFVLFLAFGSVVTRGLVSVLQLHYLRLPKDISEDYVILMDSTVSTGAAALMAVRVLLVRPHSHNKRRARSKTNTTSSSSERI